jgi:uncharacterized protein YhfF
VKATALVLDATHRGRALTIDVPDGTRPLVALARDTWPLGHRVTEGHAWFAFIESQKQESRAWTQDTALWKLYIDAVLGGWEPPTRDFDVFAFGSTPEQAARLAHHVVKGEKRGTTGWVAQAKHDGSVIPVPGMVSIVTDGFGIPLCAIQTERVVFNTFAEATEEIARAEAEGDMTLEDWREGHRTYFEGEAALIGVPFSDESELFHEYFRVLRILGN